ncbi:GNAT family N-acetyltransferase [Leifsonia aquatica]|uniref:GNAT family N-acetyltransferase n=1 Tax=Leifsonia aquatica TaxID=144185 RepID=UPI00046AB2CD|nr:GNAT family N-acetyltransferase [Leifsonia aquatica]
MVDPRTVADEYWAAVFAVPRGRALWAPGIHTTYVPEAGGGVYVLVVGAAVRVRAPARLRTDIAAVLEGLTPESALKRDVWSVGLRAHEPLVLGPATHYLAGGSDRFDGAAERVTPSAVAELARTVPADEIEESGVCEPDAVLFGLHSEGELAAVASLSPWAGAHTDVGILTMPVHRGRGFAREVGGAALAAAIRGAGFARWRSRDDNAASTALARRLGLAAYGRNLGIRLGAGTSR